MLLVRTHCLLRHFGESPVAGPDLFLARLGTKAVDALHGSEFSQSGSPARKLTNRGYALAADLGLLVARLLLSEYPDTLKWSIQTKPKSDLAYNLPVLVGFAAPAPLEPVGGSIAEAQGVLRGNRGARAWADIFGYWVSKVPV